LEQFPDFGLTGLQNFLGAAVFTKNCLLSQKKMEAVVDQKLAYLAKKKLEAVVDQKWLT